MKNLLRFLTISRLSKSPSMFDKQKLTWMNNQYMKKMSLEEVIELAFRICKKQVLSTKK